LGEEICSARIYEQIAWPRGTQVEVVLAVEVVEDESAAVAVVAVAEAGAV
jgi:hypothetical protein